jgi:PleD family two-component response regulator
MNPTLKPAAVPTVLIVDDARLNVEILNQILSGEYRTVRAYDGRQALDLAVAYQPDIILLDVVMPGLDGYQVCTILKSDSRTRNIPVIFVTGMDDDDADRKAFAAGGSGYLTKPFRPAMVLSQVHIHLELRRAKDLLATYRDEHAASESPAGRVRCA